MINMDTMKIKATKVEITRRKEDDLPGYKNDHKHYKKSYKKSDGGFNQKMDQEDLKTYTAADEPTYTDDHSNLVDSSYALLITLYLTPHTENWHTALYRNTPTTPSRVSHQCDATSASNFSLMSVDLFYMLCSNRVVSWEYLNLDGMLWLSSMTLLSYPPLKSLGTSASATRKSTTFCFLASTTYKDPTNYKVRVEPEVESSCPIDLLPKSATVDAVRTYLPLPTTCAISVRVYSPVMIVRTANPKEIFEGLPMSFNFPIP
ncbi:hypothetical protein Tco_0123087 [Tanacetum coccineum]